MGRRWSAAVLLVGVTACSGLPGVVVTPQPADPAVVQRIVSTCMASGLFKLAEGFVLAAVPGGPLARAVIDAGVDRVCADPARFAADVSTVEWVAKNLAGYIRARL